MSKPWVPLESNPEVITEFSQTIGLDASYAWVDVVGLDEEDLAETPQPVSAVLLLYPSSAKIEADLRAEDKELDAEGQIGGPVFYMKQIIHNACGPIAVIHSLANAGVTYAPDSLLDQFIKGTEGMTAAERGAYLDTPPEGAPDFEAASLSAAAAGATAAPSADDDVDYHFVALVPKDGSLYQLDGNRKGPIDHGPTTPETFLADAAKIIQEFVNRTHSIEFSVLALTAAS